MIKSFKEPVNQQMGKQGKQRALFYKSNRGPQEVSIVLKFVHESNTRVLLSNVVSRL